MENNGIPSSMGHSSRVLHLYPWRSHNVKQNKYCLRFKQLQPQFADKWKIQLILTAYYMCYQSVTQEYDSLQPCILTHLLYSSLLWVYTFSVRSLPIPELLLQQLTLIARYSLYIDQAQHVILCSTFYNCVKLDHYWWFDHYLCFQQDKDQKNIGPEQNLFH